MKILRTLLVLSSVFFMGISGAGIDYNKTSQFFGDRSTWDRVAIELTDIDAATGGTVIKIASGGAAVVSIYKPVKQAGFRFSVSDYRLKISPFDRADMIQTFVINDLLAIDVQDRAGIADESRITITVTNAKGQKFSVSKWHDARNKEFNRIYDGLMYWRDQVISNPPSATRLER